MKKFIFLAGIALGFVAGSRAGRDTYDNLEKKARAVVEDPRVQEKVEQVRETASTTAADVASTVKEKAPAVAEVAKDKASKVAATAKDAGDKAANTAHEGVSKADKAVKADKTPKNTAGRSGDSATAPAADTDSRAASTGGAGKVGDKKLES